jgi:type VII secretion-associated serine protease mycosin
VVIEPSPTASVTLPSGEKLVTVACVTDSADVVSVDVPASQAQAAIRTLPLETSCDVAAVDRPVSIATTNDAYRYQQYALNNVSFEDAWHQADGTGVTVAVIDTGVEASHPDLAGQLLSGRDYVGGVDSGWTATDPNGHGTHVSGIIAARSGNGMGISGAAPGVKILPVRVLGADGIGSLADVAAGIRWAADNGAKVINLSLGATTGDISLETQVTYALGRGVVIVAAAGNDHTNAAFYPASYAGVIAVAATTSDNQRATFSNYGSQIAVSAPGVAITSTYKGGAYEVLSGTSMASPYAAAEAALIVQANPSLAPAGVKDRMQSTARDIGAANFDQYTGYGLIDPSKALCAQAGVCIAPVAPTITSVSPALGSTGGGNSVTITGANFDWVTNVKFGLTNASSYVVDSSTSITAVSPARSAGPVDLSVVNKASTGTIIQAFTYGPPPSLISVSPASDLPAGGATVTIGGSNFSGATAVTFGGTPATSFTVVSDTQISAVAPAHAAGAVSIVVTNTYGSGSLAGAFTYVAPAATGGSAGSSSGSSSSSSSSTSSGSSAGGGGGSGASAEVLEVRPAFGPITGGTKVLILGYGFWGANAVTIGGVPATQFRYIDAATVEAVTPPGVTGWQQIVVTLAVGRATAAFRYEDVIAVHTTPPGSTVPQIATSPTPQVDPAVVVAPTGVNAKVRGGMATVTWRHVHTTARHREVVTVYAGGKAVKRVAVPSGASKIVVRGLKKGVAYSFKVTMTAGGKRLTSMASRPVRLLA